MSKKFNPQFPCGAIPDKKDKRDYRLCGVTQYVTLPESFELEERFSPNNQFSRGSCTCQSQAHHKERQEGEEMSARFVMALAKKEENNKDYGAYTRTGFKIVKNFGACPEGYYGEPDATMSWEDYIDWTKIPENCYSEALKHKSGSYWRVDIEAGYTKGWEEIKQAIYQYKNSVVISMPWYKSYNNSGSVGLLPEPDVLVGYHAVEVCGFLQDGLLKCKNSWGSFWRDHGYFYIKEGVHTIIDAWISTDELLTKFPVDAYYNRKRTWADYLLELKIVSNPWLWGKIKRAPSPREVTALRWYWAFEAVFKGKFGMEWLYKTYPDYLASIKK